MWEMERVLWEKKISLSIINSVFGCAASLGQDSARNRSAKIPPKFTSLTHDLNVSPSIVRKES